nr:lipocalin [Thetidibacter halocola]
MALILLLSACTATPLPPASIPVRNLTMPVASQADATLERLRGDWVVVQGAGMAPGARLRFEEDRVSLVGGVSPVVQTGPGRVRIGGEEIWIHWIDADGRTAALGDPGGARVWIMDRSGRPGERLVAARTILDWYGYDLERMEGS